MSRARSAAALLAAVAVIVPASVAAGSGGTVNLSKVPSLSPTPPVPLPAHPPAAGHHQRDHGPSAPLPQTGMSVPEELLTAALLVAAGGGARAAALRRRAGRPRVRGADGLARRAGGA
jgi:hypothetical protein